MSRSFSFLMSSFSKNCTLSLFPCFSTSYPQIIPNPSFAYAAKSRRMFLSPDNRTVAWPIPKHRCGLREPHKQNSNEVFNDQVRASERLNTRPLPLNISGTFRRRRKNRLHSIFFTQPRAGRERASRTLHIYYDRFFNFRQ